MTGDMDQKTVGMYSLSQKCVFQFVFRKNLLLCDKDERDHLDSCKQSVKTSMCYGMREHQCPQHR